jgi:hypothetical protein
MAQPYRAGHYGSGATARRIERKQRKAQKNHLRLGFRRKSRKRKQRREAVRRITETSPLPDINAIYGVKSESIARTERDANENLCH